MKKILVIIALALCLNVQADERASAILSKLSSSIRSLGNYGVSFQVDGGSTPVAGFYAVAGDSYYMILGDAEVYCDGKVRYEVNNAKKEVVIDVVDTSSSNIINNPTRGFDFLDTEYSSSLLWERDGVAAIKLTPKKANSATNAVIVQIDTAKSQPKSITYEIDGQTIVIAVRSITAEKMQPKTFQRSEYKTYEFIDFR